MYGNGNLNTAEYWEYDTRLGRRWNIDPLADANEAPYLVFGNSPIYFTDLLGLCEDCTKPDHTGTGEGQVAYTSAQVAHISRGGTYYTTETQEWRWHEGTSQLNYLDAGWKTIKEYRTIALPVIQASAIINGDAHKLNQSINPETGYTETYEKALETLNNFAEDRLFSPDFNSLYGKYYLKVTKMYNDQHSGSGRIEPRSYFFFDVASLGLDFALRAAVRESVEFTIKKSGSKVGAYMLEFDNGFFYAGKGPETRMNSSIARIEKTYGVKATSKLHYPTANDVAAFVKEHELMMAKGGPQSIGNTTTYNKIHSPGKKISEQKGFVSPFE